MQTISVDSKTIIIKADNENDLSEVMEFLTRKDKKKNLTNLLKIASENKIIEKDYKFDRNECYDR